MLVEQEFETLPGDVESTPPGPALAGVLAGVAPEGLSGFDAVRFARAQRRQLAHEQARFARAARVAARAEQEARMGAAPAGWLAERFCGDELRAALVASGWKVAQWLRLAGFAADHPDVEGAWCAGVLDEDRVRVLCEGTAVLSGEHATGVLEVVVPEAPWLTLRSLERRVAEVAVGLDPEWAQRTYQRRVAQRRVRARRTEGGTLNLSGLDLPLDQGAESVAHVTALAARAQALGHPGLVDTIRTDVYLALLSERFDGLGPRADRR